MRKTKTARGFTLIEMMVVGGIVAILGAMAVSGVEGISERAAPQNAAYDLSAAFAKARARAAERNTNVWVMIWPEGVKPGSTDTTTQNTTPPRGGAWVLYEDQDMNFDFANTVTPDAVVDAGKNKVMARKYLADYAKKNVVFGIPTSTARTGLESNVDTKTAATTSERDYMFTKIAEGGGCTFCSGSGEQQRGAVVFTPDGEARFVNSEGLRSYAAGTGKVSMINRSGTKHAFLFVISQATSYVSFFSH